jgi:hypothetical protein
MNIHELSTYNLADAVKFHRRLNPRIWGRDEHLLPEVREKLLAIAEDFQEFLGVEELDVEDITVSGSNAAYSYTKCLQILCIRNCSTQKNINTTTNTTYALAVLM